MLNKRKGNFTICLKKGAIKSLYELDLQYQLWAYKNDAYIFKNIYKWFYNEYIIWWRNKKAKYDEKYLNFNELLKIFLD